MCVCVPPVMPTQHPPRELSRPVPDPETAVEIDSIFLGDFSGTGLTKGLETL